MFNIILLRIFKQYLRVNIVHFGRLSSVSFMSRLEGEIVKTFCNKWLLFVFVMWSNLNAAIKALFAFLQCKNLNWCISLRKSFAVLGSIHFSLLTNGLFSVVFIIWNISGLEKG